MSVEHVLTTEYKTIQCFLSQHQRLSYHILTLTYGCTGHQQNAARRAFAPRRYTCKANHQSNATRIFSHWSKGVSVSLPLWEDTVGWSSRNPQVLALLKTGYPRFFIHRLIDRLAEKIVERFHTHNDHLLSLSSGRETLLGMLFPCKRSADQCAQFLRKSLPEIQTCRFTVLSFCKESNSPSRLQTKFGVDWQNLELYAVVYPNSAFSFAKSFWQHTGFGISSRYAVLCLEKQDLLSLKIGRCDAESGSHELAKGLGLPAAGDIDSPKARHWMLHR